MSIAPAPEAAFAASRTSRGLARRHLRTAAEFIVVPLVVVVAWWVVSHFVGPNALASPAATARELRSDAGGWGSDVLTTVRTLVIAFGLVAVVGVGLGFLVGMSSFWSEVLRPLLVAGYSVPKIVLYPMFLLVFGVSETGRLMFAGLHGVIPVMIIAMEATRAVPEIHLKVARTYRMSRLAIMRLIIIPSVFGQMIGGLRVGFSLTFLGVIVAEFFSSYSGLGYLLNTLITGIQLAAVLAVVAIIFAMAAIGHILFVLLERWAAARGVSQDRTLEVGEL